MTKEKMRKKNDNSLGKFLALVLRHKPEAANITLDGHGWADVTELINGMNAVGQSINMEMLERIVSIDNKQRYSFNDNKTKIRANQGHSVDVDVELKEIVPPEYLYHGTATRFIDSIMLGGIKPMSRLYVHLSENEETARGVGARHGNPVVIGICSGQMHSDGIKFYLSHNGVWLVDNVPVKYFRGLVY